jgi:signal transduction histidine kinase
MLFAALGADFDSWLASAFYCYLLLSAVLGHDWPDVPIVSGSCIVFMALLPSPEADLLRRLVLFAGLLACALAVSKGKLQRRLEQAARNGQELQDEVQKACAAERDRIAGDFHDGPLQDVISLQVRLEVVKNLLERDPSSGLKELEALQQVSQSVVTELRSFLRTMRPPPIEGPDLAASVRLVVDDFQEGTDIQVRFAAPTAPITAAPETALEALQILREALHNVRKHSQATGVVISLERTGQTLEMAVEDDGAGFAFGGSFTLEELERLRLGPQSIQQRVRKLGGDLRLESRPGQGAALRIWIPI